jgi:hypothetical protein
VLGHGLIASAFLLAACVATSTSAKSTPIIATEGHTAKDPIEDGEEEEKEKDAQDDFGQRPTRHCGLIGHLPHFRSCRS